MIPVVQDVGASGIPIEPLWWALAMGACFGGNAKIIGASANVVVADLAARNDPISFGRFLRYGSLVTVVSLAISTVHATVRYLG